MERSEIKPYIAKRVAKELHDGDVVNLGIGLPTMVPDYLDPSVKLTLQSENGFIGLAAVDPEDPDAAYIVNAGGQPAGIEKPVRRCPAGHELHSRRSQRERRILLAGTDTGNIARDSRHPDHRLFGHGKSRTCH